LIPEDWVPRAEIKKIVNKVLKKNEDFAEKIRKLQIVIEKKKKKN